MAEEQPNHDLQAREPRESVMLSATIEFDGGPPTKHRLRDLSATGARIDQAAEIPLGATVVVTVGALEAVGATVMWVRNGAAGLQFATTINPQDARAKAAVAPDSKASSRISVPAPKAKAGWLPSLDSPYRR